jgi:hypothetical protein
MRFRSYGAAPFVWAVCYKDVAPTEPFVRGTQATTTGRSREDDDEDEAPCEG